MANRPKRPQARAWKLAADLAGYEEFDPLNRVNLGRSVEMALLSRPLTPLGHVGPFWGTGIYAIYFAGPSSHDLYGRLARSPSPIYVGRAVPKGARKGLAEAEESRASKTLWTRLFQHANSVDQASNLDLEDFRCRWLVADMLFVPMAERLMIQTYRPLWNVSVDGFGNHDPGGGRYEGDRSRWDTLHPGRPWAPLLADPPYTADDLRAQAAAHLSAHQPELAPVLPPLTGPATIDAALSLPEEI